MTETLYQSFGGITLPFGAADVDDDDLSFGAADTALSTLLSLFSAAISAELNHDGAWTKVCASLPSDCLLYASTTPVNDTLAIEPTEDVMQTVKSGFPLLCLHRYGEAEFEQDTIESGTRKQRWLLHWILGPLNGVGPRAKLAGALRIASAAVQGAAQTGSHPNHSSGSLVLFGSTLDGPHVVDSVRVVAEATGDAAYDGKENSLMTSLVVTLETLESTTDTLAADADVAGMDMHISVGNANELWPDLVIVDTDNPGTMYEP